MRCGYSRCWLLLDNLDFRVCRLKAIGLSSMGNADEGPTVEVECVSIWTMVSGEKSSELSAHPFGMSCGRIVQPCHKRSILIEVTCFPGNASGNPAVGRMHSDGRFASFFDLSSLVTSNA